MLPSGNDQQYPPLKDVHFDHSYVVIGSSFRFAGALFNHCVSRRSRYPSHFRFGGSSRQMILRTILILGKPANCHAHSLLCTREPAFHPEIVALAARLATHSPRGIVDFDVADDQS